MSKRLDRIVALNPLHIIERIENITKSKEELGEVLIRRFISAIYFAIFNYWAAKQFHLKGRRGRGPYQDSFLSNEFHQDLLRKGLDAQIITLFQYRVAVDHYILNPTTITVYNKEVADLLGRNKILITVSKKVLTKIIDSAKEILSEIDKS